MNKLKLYNTLSRKKEEFKPIKKGEVGLYTCGPTVYNYAHIGNLRTYIFEDILRRVLEYNGYKVKHVMNITDVGHLTGDQDMGEDKLEKGAKREGKSAWEIADFYTEAFKKDIARLNILEPNTWCKATDNIPEQIDLVKTLEKKGYTYKTTDGIYFDTSKFKDYNKLSHLKLEELQEGARVEKNEEKKNPTDFALWKFSPNPPAGGEKRQMEWESPWGVGFPGWHIECSAMSMKFLGGQLDIHCGGIDHINIHHTNEIAQSEAATEKPFFNYWMHGAFLNISGGKKMAKSADNFLRLEKVENYEFDIKGLKVGSKGMNLNSLALRYLFLNTQYRKGLEFSWESLKAARISLGKIIDKVKGYKEAKEGGKILKNYQDKFIEKINNDLNTAEALSIMWKVIRSKENEKDKLVTILDFDRVLGLNLEKIKPSKSYNLSAETGKFEVSGSGADLKMLPKDVKKIMVSRETAREKNNFEESDRLRNEIEKLGYIVEDTKDGMRVYKK